MRVGEGVRLTPRAGLRVRIGDWVFSGATLGHESPTAQPAIPVSLSDSGSDPLGLGCYGLGLCLGLGLGLGALWKIVVNV